MPAGCVLKALCLEDETAFASAQVLHVQHACWLCVSCCAGLPARRAPCPCHGGAAEQEAPSWGQQPTLGRTTCRLPACLRCLQANNLLASNHDATLLTSQLSLPPERPLPSPYPVAWSVLASVCGTACRPASSPFYLTPYEGKYEHPDTTPDGVTMQKVLSSMADRGATAAVVEVDPIKLFEEGR